MCMSYKLKSLEGSILALDLAARGRSGGLTMA